MMTEIDYEQLIQRIRKTIIGRYFSNKSELRHMAERAGFSFVPVEFLVMEDYEAVMALRPKVADETRLEIRVKATRPVPWQPYYITEVVPA